MTNSRSPLTNRASQPKCAISLTPLPRRRIRGLGWLAPVLRQYPDRMLPLSSLATLNSHFSDKVTSRFSLSTPQRTQSQQSQSQSAFRPFHQYNTHPNQNFIRPPQQPRAPNASARPQWQPQPPSKPTTVPPGNTNVSGRPWNNNGNGYGQTRQWQGGTNTAVAPRWSGQPGNGHGQYGQYSGPQAAYQVDAQPQDAVSQDTQPSQDTQADRPNDTSQGGFFDYYEHAFPTDQGDDTAPQTVDEPPSQNSEQSSSDNTVFYHHLELDDRPPRTHIACRICDQTLVRRISCTDTCEAGRAPHNRPLFKSLDRLSADRSTCLRTNITTTKRHRSNSSRYTPLTFRTGPTSPNWCSVLKVSAAA